MKIGRDLNSASRETLLVVIAEQQAVIVELRRRIDELERRVSRGPSAGMPGNKPTSKRRESEGRKPRKQRAHGFARQRMKPTRRVIHAAESCPECGTGLTGGWVQRTREVIEPVFVARMCALCGQRWLPQDPLKGLVMGRQRFGVNLVSLTPGHLPCSSLTHPLPLSSRRPSVDSGLSVGLALTTPS